MATFEIEKIKIGYKGGDYSYVLSIKDIKFDENDETVRLPDTYNGEPITHVGYSQTFIPAHEEWADWHHPSKGSDFVPAKYDKQLNLIHVPEHVKKIILPSTIIDGIYAFTYANGTVIEREQ
ncbi:MAG: hypothetical protein IJ515_04070 [Clostridia bacterium]|nr:hypothetical protein [Clostridia bacterium]